MVPSSLITTLPFAGVVVSVMVSGSLSGSESLSRTAIVTGVSSSELSASSTATGASFVPPIVTVTIAVSNPPLPSVIVYSKESVPLKSGFGV